MVAHLKVERLAIGVLVAAMLGACSSSDEGSDDSRVHFTPLERESRSVEPVDAPAPSVSLEERPEYKKIIEGFRSQAVQLFQRDDIDRRLNQIERVFIGTGKYLELVAVYQDVVDELGLESPAAPRLARGYIRLGQREQAREFLDKLKEARPEDAQVAFLEGLYAVSAPQQTAEAASQAVTAWRRTLELDPDFEGPGRMTADRLERQIEQLDKRASAGDRGGQQQPGPVAQADQPGSDGTGPGAPAGDDQPDDEKSADDETAGEDSADGADRESTDEAESPEQKTGAERADVGMADEADDGDGASEPTPDAGGETPAGVLVLRADEARATGNLEKAAETYQKVLDRAPDHLDAKFGLLQVDWKRDGNADDIAGRLKSLLDHPELTAREAYQMAQFADGELGRAELAETFRQRVRELDADYADKLGIGE
jgi:tetratricopeptide (TPR) repeat protein